MKNQITFNGVTKLVNFTEPQERIMMRLLSGEKTTYIHTNRASGGEFVWFRKDGDYENAECVGYKAFNGAMRAIKKAFNLTQEQEISLYNKYVIK